MSSQQKCLYCGLEAESSETYEGTQVYLCSAGHRTGILIDNQDVSEDTKALKVA